MIPKTVQNQPFLVQNDPKAMIMIRDRSGLLSGGLQQDSRSPRWSFEA